MKVNRWETRNYILVLEFIGESGFVLELCLFWLPFPLSTLDMLSVNSECCCLMSKRLLPNETLLVWKEFFFFLLRIRLLFFSLVFCILPCCAVYRSLCILVGISSWIWLSYSGSQQFSYASCHNFFEYHFHSFPSPFGAFITSVNACDGSWHFCLLKKKKTVPPRLHLDLNTLLMHNDLFFIFRFLCFTLSISIFFIRT